MAETPNGNRWWVTLAGGGVVAVTTALVAQFATVGTLQAQLDTLTEVVNGIEESQKDVRERLPVLEGFMDDTGGDRYRSGEASRANEHVQYRLDSLMERIQRVEAACFETK